MTKEYGKKVASDGNTYQLLRTDKVETFLCNRCYLEKTAKLHAVRNENKEEKICNGCYGKILSE